MLDIKYIRANQEKIKKTIKLKKLRLNLDELLELDNQRLELLQKIESLRAKRNEINDQIKKASNDNERKELIKKTTELKQKVVDLEDQFKKTKEKFDNLMVLVPTVQSSDTPIGESEKDNVEISKWGKIPDFDFKPRTHVELGKILDILDLERGAKVAGYRGYYLKNEGTMLVLGLMMYAIRKMIEHGYKPLIPPTLVKEFALFGTGYFAGKQYNSAEDNIYQVASRDKEKNGQDTTEKKFLVGTAEPSLLAYHAGEILDEEDLPILYSGYSQCYRSEIGSYGKDTIGHYRVHEFIKVEQVVLEKADINLAEEHQEKMLAISQKMHEELGLPGRKIIMCTGDLGAGKYRQYDLEAWCPGLKRYAETGSASIFKDWQSRRLNVKYKTKDGQKKYVYMMNNTALPSPRVFIAILENYQQKDGSVVVPEVLREYVGKDIIKPSTIKRG